MTTTLDSPRCTNLVLDSGPLLSLSPLRGLAETYLTVPQVLDELKDKRARDHFQRLGLNAGVKIEIRNPDAASLSHVIAFSKKTGDYSVLSHPDLCVLALTYQLHVKAQEAAKKAEQEAVLNGEAAAEPVVEAPAAEEPKHASLEDQLDGETAPLSEEEEADAEASQEPSPETTDPEEQQLEALDVELVSENQSTEPEPTAPPPKSTEPLFEDPSDDDDGEGEWITPSNVALHKSRASGLLPSEEKGKGKAEPMITAGCMTADFAMQNVLLQMGMSLVGVEGKRIQKVKSWVLRCHACFKICKDNSKKFCPSCGNNTLLRASVTIAAPGTHASVPAMQVHLKKNFVYKTRGTVYSIPAPKAGSAKKGAGNNLILREDQQEYMRARKHADGKREREEKKMLKGVFSAGGEGGVGVGSWNDPDWMPSIMAAGTGGKGRSVRHAGMDGDMPQIGFGRKNPNEKRRKK